jgi:hypothetical protein
MSTTAERGAGAMLTDPEVLGTIGEAERRIGPIDDCLL